MQSHRVNIENTQNFDPAAHHEDVVSTDGLEDLFNWASEMVADGKGSDTRGKRIREHKLRRNVLEIIQKNKEHEAHEKASEEIGYLQKRVIALLQVLQEKIDENAHIKQVMVSQYFTLQKLPELESEVKQLRLMTWYRDEAETERKHLMNALAKLKKERDFLDELLMANENENMRLGKMLKEYKAQLDQLRNRKWWHFFKRILPA